MYLQYYGLNDYPFSVTPDPAFLYLGTSHREALGHLLYGAGEHGGFVQLTGEVGTGKTTLIRALLDSPADDLDVALCWHPQLDVREFVANICDELGVAYDRDGDNTLKSLVDQLNAHLLESHAAGRRTLLIIDEAQNLSREVLEQLRLLTNLETRKHKLLRIILVGQPELDTFLARHDLRQLSQRISARFTLTSLEQHETADYISHRLACAGGSGRLFSPAACRMVYWHTRGTPRLINLVCERALMGNYANGRAVIGPWTVHKAARETLAQSHGERSAKRFKRPATVAAVVLLAVLALFIVPGAQIEQAFAWMTASDNGIVTKAEAAPVIHDSEGQSQVVTGKTGGNTDNDKSPMPDINAEPLRLGGVTTDSSAGHAKQPIKLAANTVHSAAADRKNAASSGDAAESAKDKAKRAPELSTLLPDGDAQMSQLLRQWGVLGAKTEASCDSFHVGKLYCLTEHGTLTMLDRFNRPAILTLSYDGHKQRVLLTALGKKMATLAGADSARRIKREQLAQLWTGQFSMIWRANTGVIYIHDNMIGGAVVWLRKRLARATHSTAENKEKPKVGPMSPIFDDKLEARVRHFQLMHGLKPDGIAGPRTQIMLNGIAPAPGTPTLKPEQEEKD